MTSRWRRFAQWLNLKLMPNRPCSFWRRNKTRYEASRRLYKGDPAMRLLVDVLAHPTPAERAEDEADPKCGKCKTCTAPP